MSGQYPSGYQSPSGHRGNFNNPMMQQQLGGGGGGGVAAGTGGVGVPGQMGFNQAMQQNQQQQMQQGQAGGGGGVELGMNPNQMGGGQPTAQSGSQGQGGQGQQSQAPQQSPQSGGQQQQQQQGGGMIAPAGQPGPVATTGQPNMQQQKEFNLLTLCRIGQETVQDIVSRFQEVFGILRVIQPPNGTNQGLTASNDKKAKVQEQFRTIRLLFKRLRLLYDKCNDFCQQGMEYTHVEGLIPLKGEPERTEPVHTEEYKKALQENRELIEIVMLKNKQLREIIDKIRLTIWEINTMLSMRRC